MGCRGRDQRSVLVRVVLVADGAVVRAEVDRAASAPGRGAWVHDDPRCLELAERRRAFSRALRVDTVDTTAVRDELWRRDDRPPAVARPSFTEHESGLEADGHPMSTQR